MSAGGAAGSASPTTSCWRASWRSDLVRRRTRRRSRAAASSGDGRIRARIADALPFALTAVPARRRSRRSPPTWHAPRRMLRLLQGDVGSGKTVVALMAMAIAVEARRAGRADGADRGAGAAACRDNRAAGRRGGAADRAADRAREGQAAQGAAGRVWQRARSTS